MSAKKPVIRIEYRLLTALVRNVGKVMAHRQLLKEVWGPSHVEHHHYLRVYMANLRNKLEGDSARPRLLLTVAGVGYRLATSEELGSAWDERLGPRLRRNAA